VTFYQQDITFVSVIELKNNKTKKRCNEGMSEQVVLSGIPNVLLKRPHTKIGLFCLRKQNDSRPFSVNHSDAHYAHNECVLILFLMHS
jgi:hypothetical protein